MRREGECAGERERESMVRESAGERQVGEREGECG